MNLTEENLAEKLRRDNCDQFNILVRMHLSFVLDLNADDSSIGDKYRFKKWPFYKKSKNGNKGILEGAPLTHEGVCQVYQLIEFLRKEPNLYTEGIFRRTGSLARQQELRNLLHQGITLNLEGSNFSVHDCASVLKGFLAELPEPLLTDAHFMVYCQIAELCGITEKPTQESRLLHSLQLLLLLLPPENRVLLKDVLDLLHLTASYEHQNKMSAESLATLFTPHLLCPRNLSPENLHTNSQNLSGIIAFMIRKASELFKIPTKLAVDIKAFYSEKEKRKLLSPRRDINESITDTAKTVYSFIDHEKTAKENQLNPTETALAQLYAHIQSMPESSKKRKLIKQFNKENGQGVPLQVLRSSTSKTQKSVGDSIKKRIFHKGLTKGIKSNGFIHQKSSSEECLSTPCQTPLKTRLFCTKCNNSDVSADEKLIRKSRSCESLNSEDIFERNLNISRHSKSELDLNSDEFNDINKSYLTSTPACYKAKHTCINVMFTPDNQGRKSMSPITKSTQRMSKTMQETMMTPRSRKPVLLVSGTNITNLPKFKQDCNMDSVEELSETDTRKKISKKSLRRSKSASDLHCSSEDESNSLTDTFKDYLSNRSILVQSSPDLMLTDIKNLSPSKLSSSLLFCLNGHKPEESDDNCINKTNKDVYEKELVLRPKQFDENGMPTVYETSF